MNTKHVSSSIVGSDKSSIFEVSGQKLVIWDVYEQHEIDSVSTQLDVITKLSDNIQDAVKHLQINGYQVSKAV